MVKSISSLITEIRLETDKFIKDMAKDSKTKKKFNKQVK
jgi:hypothetical protein